MKEMRIILNNVAGNLNCSEDQMVLLACIFVSFPLGFINYFIKSPTLRIVYGLVTGLLIQFFMFEDEMIHCLGATVFTFLYIKFVSRTPYSSPTLLLLMLIAHFSYLHLRQMFGWVNLEQKDITLIHMVLICKLSSVVYCYEDGLTPDTKIKNEYQRNCKIVIEPTFLEFLSYSFYYSTAAVGPYYEFADFINFIRLEKEYTNIPMLKAMYNSFYELVYGFICMFIFLSYKDVYYNSFVLTKEFSEFPYFYKLFYLNVSMLVYTCRYYIAWKFITSVNIFNGLSYDCEEKTTIDGEVVVQDEFTKIQSAQILKVVFNPNVKEKIEGWNHQVHLWLKYQVMLRFISNNSSFVRNNRVMLTYLVSAAWHGWYPIYYWVFLDFFFIDRICEVLKKDKFYERLGHSSYILQFIVGIISLHACNYLGVTFTLLKLENGITFYKNMYFIPNIIVYLTFIYVVYIKGETKTNETARVEPGKKLDMNMVLERDNVIKKIGNYGKNEVGRKKIK